MEHYINIGGVKLWSTITDPIDSNKPYMCLCGGGPGIGDSLILIDDLINSYFNVIRFEQRGCGRSSRDHNYSLGTVLDDLEEIRNFYGIKEWYILGHSWGAGISLFYALKYSKYCLGVMYISGMGIQNDIDWSEEFSMNASKLTEPEFELPEINYDVLNSGLRSYNEYIKQPLLWKQISDLKLPVLVIYGDKDIRPMWPAVQLSHLLPNCKLCIMNECGHFPWLIRPNEFREIIVDWYMAIISLKMKE
ncbi:MAG: alpha/beta hydrolase [Herbinix sp.]|jgi:proline iminopeptidase|nr:alpha/beta hydrolase [Herbinix sp.]